MYRLYRCMTLMWWIASRMPECWYILNNRFHQEAGNVLGKWLKAWKIFITGNYVYMQQLLLVGWNSANSISPKDSSSENTISCYVSIRWNMKPLRISANEILSSFWIIALAFRRFSSGYPLTLWLNKTMVSHAHHAIYWKASLQSNSKVIAVERTWLNFIAAHIKEDWNSLSLSFS